MSATQFSHLEAGLDRLTDQGNQLIRQGNELLRAARELRGEIARIANRDFDESITISADARPAPPPPPVEEEPPAPPDIEQRSVTRLGVVDLDVAKKTSQQLGEFTRAQFEEKTGLKGGACTRWLTLLMRENYIRFSAGKYRCQDPPLVRDWVVWYKDEELSAEHVARMCQLTPDDAVAELEALAKRGVVEQHENGLWQYKPVESWMGPKEHHTLAPPERTTRPAYELAQATGEPVRVAAVKKVTRRARSVSGAGGIRGAKQRDMRYKKQEEAKKQRAAEQKAKAPQGRRKKAA